MQDIPIYSFDPLAFADVIMKTYYRTISEMLKIRFNERRSPKLSGPEQWERMHLELRHRLGKGPERPEDGTAPALPDPGDSVRDAFIRAMIALYVGGPKPVDPEALVSLSKRLIEIPETFPEDMEGFDLVLEPMT